CSYMEQWRQREASPSFPTRRASDLTPISSLTLMDDCHSESGWCSTKPRSVCTGPPWYTGMLLTSLLTAVRFICDSTSPRARSSRSEEHTSELQSRENLVCRLLLENN